MSKKTKWALIGLSVLLAVVVTLSLLTIFVWTKPKVEIIKLETPLLSFREEDGLLIADNDLNATGYSFYVYSGDKPQDTFNYIEYKTDKYYFNAKPLIVDAKTYYFYCKCTGGEAFEDSNISEITSYVNKHSLSTPEIAINGTELSWRTVENASYYKIYMNGRTAPIAQTPNNEFDITSYLDSQRTINTFCVVACGDEHYIESEKSNTVSHSKVISSISNISNFRLDENDFSLQWSSVVNATKYEVVVNSSQTYYVTGTSYNFSSHITSNGTYTFKVRAIREDAENPENNLYSDYTEIKTYTKTEKLGQTTISFEKDNDTLDNNRATIIFNWTSVTKAHTYQVVIKIDGVEVLSQTMNNTSISVKQPDGASSVEIRVMAVGYDYYLDSNVVTKTANF